MGGEQRRANTNPDAVKPFSIHKLSPFNKRRTVSPSEVRMVTHELSKEPAVQLENTPAIVLGDISIVWVMNFLFH